MGLSFFELRFLRQLGPLRPWELNIWSIRYVCFVCSLADQCSSCFLNEMGLKLTCYWLCKVQPVSCRLAIRAISLRSLMELRGQRPQAQNTWTPKQHHHTVQHSLKCHLGTRPLFARTFASTYASHLTSLFRTIHSSEPFLALGFLGVSLMCSFMFLSMKGPLPCALSQWDSLDGFQGWRSFYVLHSWLGNAHRSRSQQSKWRLLRGTARSDPRNTYCCTILTDIP